MAKYADLKAAIAKVIKTNGKKEITGDILQNTLNSIVSTVGENYQFVGMAEPTTNPGAPDQNVFYIASQPGTYSNFSGITVTDEVALLMWNGSWVKKATGFATMEKVTELESIIGLNSELSLESPLTFYKTEDSADINFQAKKGDIISVRIDGLIGGKAILYLFENEEKYYEAKNFGTDDGIYVVTLDRNIVKLRIFGYGSTCLISYSKVNKNILGNSAVNNIIGEPEIFSIIPTNSIVGENGYDAFLHRSFTKGEIVSIKFPNLSSDEKVTISLYLDEEYSESGQYVVLSKNNNSTFIIPKDGYHIRAYRENSSYNELSGELIVFNKALASYIIESISPIYDNMSASNTIDFEINNNIEDVINVIVESAQYDGIKLYGVRNDNSFFYFGDITDNKEKTIQLNEIFSKIRIYNPNLYKIDASFRIINQTSAMYKSNAALSNQSEHIIYQTSKEVYSLSEFAVNENFIKGNIASISVLVDGDNNEYNVYGYTSVSENKFEKLGSIKLNGIFNRFYLKNSYERINVFFRDVKNRASCKLLIIDTKDYIGSNISIPVQKGIESSNFISKKNTINNILILGDSYSFQKRWIEKFAGKFTLRNIVNLGVSSATLRDAQKDRTQYPYTSRPSGNNSAHGIDNTNTLACQIEKLKRLMEGADLDEGETKIYENSYDYPNVILIEASKNDKPDSDGTLAKYKDVLYEIKEDVWIMSSGNKNKGNVTLVRDIESMDRTNFIGALYYLINTLHSMFPSARIYVINPSGLSYGTSNNIEDVEISYQLDICSRILSIPVIDWLRRGRCSYAFNSVRQGDGTENNPYITTDSTEDTVDMLHPNEQGADKLADVVANELFLDLPMENLTL